MIIKISLVKIMMIKIMIMEHDPRDGKTRGDGWEDF